MMYLSNLEMQQNKNNLQLSYSCNFCAFKPFIQKIYLPTVYANIIFNVPLTVYMHHTL